MYSLEASGFFLTAKSSTDGEALATDVDSDNKVDAYFLAPHVHLLLKAVADTSLDSGPALAGLRALGTIATAMMPAQMVGEEHQQAACSIVNESDAQGDARLMVSHCHGLSALGTVARYSYAID
jgi:hypothetical protein